MRYFNHSGETHFWFGRVAIGRNSPFGDIYLKVETLGFPGELDMDYERVFICNW